MALDERIALTLYDRIYQAISGSDPAAGLPSAFDSATTAFVMAQRGMVLKAADYHNPWSPGNTEGSKEAAANIASLVDDIPGPGPVYAPIGGKVSDVYRKIVKGVQDLEPPRPDLEAQREELKKVLEVEGKDEEGNLTLKPTALAVAEQKAADNYTDAYTAYVGTYVAAQADPALKAMWPMLGAQALQKPKRAFADWAAAGRDQVESVKGQLAVLNTGQVARAFADAQFRLNAFETVVAAEQDTFLRTSITPSDWASADASTWPSYHFNESTYASEFTTEANAWGGGANVQAGLWSFGGDVTHVDSRQAMSQDTTNIGVSFKWRVCPVSRKWMDASLFKLPHWSLGSLGGPGVISGGLMPLIPIALVIVRDVEVTANWSHQDSERLSEATSGSASVGWGPFAVSGHYSHSSTSDRFSAKASDQGFNVADIQVLGFVCLRVPPCPPM
ncbi:hypothetical protein ACWEN4_19915 [Streptomyces violaceorubidus]